MHQNLDRNDVIFGASPSHFAMTCDGHRRFAIEHGLSMTEGYGAGLEIIFSMIPWVFVDHKVEVFSINWMPYSITVDPSSRAKSRAQAVWESMLIYFTSDKVNVFRENKVRFLILGEKNVLPLNVLNELEALEDSTRIFSSRKFYMGLGYSHLREMLSASRKFSGEINDILGFAQNLWVQEPVDLFYRPGGVCVRGDFLLLQSVHARIFFEKKLLPELTKDDVDRVFTAYEDHNAEHVRTNAITRQSFL